MADRKISVPTRRENTREKQTLPTTIRFNLAEIETHFDQNLAAIHAQTVIAAEMQQNGNRTEAEFIWRTQILYLESALDYYMHELTTYGMVQMYARRWPRTNGYAKIKLAITAIDEGLTYPGSADWLVSYVSDAFGRDTLTNYPRIKDQAELLGIDLRAIMKTAFPLPEDSKKRTNSVNYGAEILTELCIRRNRIAHQTDRDPDNAIQMPISSDYVRHAISHVERLVQALHRAAEKLDNT